MTRLRGLTLVACLAPILGAPSAATAQQPASLVTVGVDTTQASLTAATYSLLVANRGNAIARNVELTNTVPTNMRFSSSDRATACASGAPSGTQCRWALGDIPPGVSQTVSVTYALEQSESAYGQSYAFSNTASAQASGDASAQSNTDTSLARTSHLLEQDAHADGGQPTQNFGACPQLLVRRDNAITAFAETELTPNPTNYPFAEGGAFVNSGLGGVERLWGAVLRAAVASRPATAPPIVVHRIVSGDWEPGTGSCAGAAGSGTQVRGEKRPVSEASPTATASIPGTGPVAWDVHTAFDTREERGNFNGFELRAAGPTSPATGADTVAFHSAQAAATDDRPRLVTLATRRENDRCIDTDPEMSTSNSDREQRIDAYVTDGAGGRISNDGGDGCPGYPVPDTPVGWELDDDDPDAYIASRAGSETVREIGASGDAAPNEVSTRTDALGRTFVGVRLGEPYEEEANPETRVAAIVLDQNHDGYVSPVTGSTSGTCEPGETISSGGGVPRQCSSTGEDQTEDDVHTSWTYVAAPPIVTPPGGGGGTGGGGGAPSGATSSSSSLQPEPASARSIVMQASRTQAMVGDTVRFTGRVTSSAPACSGPREFVEILRRRRGTRTLTSFASAATAADGTFELPAVVDVSAEYVAVSPARSGCTAASSAPAGVLGRGRVHIWSAGSTLVRRGSRIVLRGRIRPALGGSVVVERRVGRRWSAVAPRRVSRDGSFVHHLTATWVGSRAFRARWRPASLAYGSGVSRTLTLTARN